MPSGNVVLNVGGREFVTPLDLPVQPGNRLQLEVQQGDPATHTEAAFDSGQTDRITNDGCNDYPDSATR